MQASETEVKMEDPSVKQSCQSDSDSEDDERQADNAASRSQLTLQTLRNRLKN